VTIGDQWSPICEEGGGSSTALIIESFNRITPTRRDVSAKRNKEVQTNKALSKH